VFIFDEAVSSAEPDPPVKGSAFSLTIAGSVSEDALTKYEVSGMEIANMEVQLYFGDDAIYPDGIIDHTLSDGPLFTGDFSYTFSTADLSTAEF
jgi:hypothetical protein